MIRFNKPTIEKKDLESVLYCMIEDDLTPGVYAKNFSTMLSKILGIRNVGVFNTYFDSFEVIFHLLEISNRDDIILPSFSRLNILNTLKKHRLNPVLVDLQKDSLLPSFKAIEKKISKNTKCIIIPQLFGIPYNISCYLDFGLPVIEDMDNAIGSKIDNRTVGSFGNFATMNFNDFSIITTGSGGMVASSDRRLNRFLKNLKDDAFYIDYIMSDFNASLGISQLNKLKKSIEIRRRIGKLYDDAILSSHASLIGRDEGKEIVYSSYVVRTLTPFGEVKNLFKKYGVPVKRAIEIPLHQILGQSSKDYSNTDEIANQLIALPIYPSLAKNDIENIVKGIRIIL